MIKEKLNNIKKIISLLCFIMIFINFFFDMMLISKISIGIILLMASLVLYFDAVKKINNKMFTSVIMTIIIFILPFCYYFGFENYKINKTPILYHEEINGIIYEFNNVESTFYIIGEGETKSFGGSYEIPWKKYIKGIAYVEIDSKITKIGNSLFSQCNKIKNVTLGENIVSIGHFTFANCDNLTSFNTKEKNTIILPVNCVALGDYAFNECNKIKKVFIPKTMIYIGESALNISSLEEIYFEGDEALWNNIIKQNNAIPQNIKIYYNSTINDF